MQLKTKNVQQAIIGKKVEKSLSYVDNEKTTEISKNEKPRLLLLLVDSLIYLFFSGKLEKTMSILA